MKGPPLKGIFWHVSAFRRRLRRACEVAGENLRSTQAKMKVWCDRKTRSQSFEVGDQVLILLPVVGSPLDARFSGPYRIEKKVGNVDYIVSTPDRRKKYRLCHINMMKPFHDTYDESKRMVESRVVGCAVLGSDPSHADDHKQSRPVGQLENSQIRFFLTFPLRPMCSHMIPRVENCVDRSGSARYVSKFELLKGYKIKNNRQRNVY